MSRIRMIMLSMLAVLAVSAVASASASADEYAWKIEGVQLKALEERNFTPKAIGSFVLDATIAGAEFHVICNTVGNHTGTKGKIIGNEGNLTAGKDEATVDFSACEVEGAPNCTVGGPADGPIEAAVKSEIVEIKEKGEGTVTEPNLDLVGILLEPKVAGSAFTTIDIDGTGCAAVVEANVTGSTVAGVNPEEPVEPAGVAEPELVWQDSNNVLKYENVKDEVKTVGLKFANNTAELIGKIGIKLESGKKFNAYGPKL
jgi:hypothetical protein